MPTFRINVPDEAFSKADQDQYIKQITEILKRAKERGADGAVDLLNGINDDFHADFKIHPRIWSNFLIDPSMWSKTARAGASNIALSIEKLKELGFASDNPEAKLIADTSTYEELHARLTKELKATSPWRKEDEAKRQALNLALIELENLQLNMIFAFQQKLRDSTANQLKAKLATIAFDHVEDQINAGKLRARIRELQNADFTKLNTAAEALSYSKKVNELRNDLISFSDKVKDKKIAADINHLSEQLSIITKRELDYYYDKPREKTTLDKIRETAQAITATIGGLAALAAFILFFIPGFQPIAGLLALVSLIAMVPVLDKVAEVVRHLWNGRTPTTFQAAELGVAIPLLATLVAGANAFPVIGAAIVAKSAIIGTALSNVGNFIATKFMNGFGAVMNLLGGAGSTAQLKNTFTPKSEKAVSEERIIHFQTGMSLFHNSEADIIRKTQVKAREHSIARAFKNTPTEVGYLYKGKVNDLEHDIHFVESHNDKIYAWQAGMFSHTMTGLQDAVKKYAALNTNSTVDERINQLKDIQQHINNHRGLEFEPLKKLEVWVSAELMTLNRIKQHMKDHAIDEKDHKPYLVHKPPQI